MPSRRSSKIVCVTNLDAGDNLEISYARMPQLVNKLRSSVILPQYIPGKTIVCGQTFLRNKTMKYMRKVATPVQFPIFPSAKCYHPVFHFYCLCSIKT